MPRREENSPATLMIVGFAFVLMMAIPHGGRRFAAFLQRQGLDTVADGAALRGADLGATGREVYTGGVPADRLDLAADQVRAGVHEYLAASGAYAEYPGLSFTVDVDRATSSVTVHVRAPLDLPLTVPGSPQVATIAATASAVVVAAR